MEEYREIAEVELSVGHVVSVDGFGVGVRGPDPSVCPGFIAEFRPTASLLEAGIRSRDLECGHGYVCPKIDRGQVIGYWAPEGFDEDQNEFFVEEKEPYRVNLPEVGDSPGIVGHHDQEGPIPIFIERAWVNGQRFTGNAQAMADRLGYPVVEEQECRRGQMATFRRTMTYYPRKK